MKYLIKTDDYLSIEKSDYNKVVYEKKESSKRVFVKGKKITFGDVCFYDKDNKSKIIVPYTKISADKYPLERYSPIGIVAVPSSHTDDGRPRIVSLAEMNLDTPDSGSVTSKHSIYWGGSGAEVTDLPIKNQLPYLSDLSEDGSVIYSTSFCYLPSDYFSGRTENPLNSLEGFDNDYSVRMCSPYKEDGSKEPRYFDTSNTGNVFADFDGKANTEKILEVDNSNSTDWQTATTISNKEYNQYVHPAAQCCWRFHTEGTQQGDWYLPSAGELGYAFARYGSINLAINTLNTQYSTTLGIKFTIYSYWSSTQCSPSNAVEVAFDYGQVYGSRKTDNNYVRAFLAL